MNNGHGPPKPTLKLESAAITNDGVYFSFYITNDSEILPGAGVSFEQHWSVLPAGLRLTIQEMLQAIEMHYSSLMVKQFNRNL